MRFHEIFVTLVPLMLLLNLLFQSNLPRCLIPKVWVALVCLWESLGVGLVRQRLEVWGLPIVLEYTEEVLLEEFAVEMEWLGNKMLETLFLNFWSWRKLETEKKEQNYTFNLKTRKLYTNNLKEKLLTWLPNIWGRSGTNWSWS